MDPEREREESREHRLQMFIRDKQDNRKIMIIKERASQKVREREKHRQIIYKDKYIQII